MTLSSNLFDVFLFLLSSLVNGPRFMAISSLVLEFFKVLTINPEIGNTPLSILLDIWRLGRVRDTRLDTNLSNEMLLNAGKYQGYSFYCF